MAYEVWWALVLGFAISAVVQARVPRARFEASLGGGGAGGAWADVASYFRADWGMLWKEIAIGFLLAGFIGLLGNDAFNSLFVSDAPAPLPLLENVVVGPLIAVLSFVCSIGNVPLAAVLWSGGISFAGVIAFIFADLV